jgi:hypothetical protein
MLDITVNNMAFLGDPNNINYGSLQPFNNQKYFHPYCPINYGDRTSTLNVTARKYTSDVVLDGGHRCSVARYRLRVTLGPKHDNQLGPVDSKNLRHRRTSCRRHEIHPLFLRPNGEQLYRHVHHRGNL